MERELGDPRELFLRVLCSPLCHLSTPGVFSMRLSPFSLLLLLLGTLGGSASLCHSLGTCGSTCPARGYVCACRHACAHTCALARGEVMP